MRSEAERLAERVARCERMLIALIGEYNSEHTLPLYVDQDYTADDDLLLMQKDLERWKDTGQV